MIEKGEYIVDDEYREWLRSLPCLKCVEEFDIEIAPIYHNDPAHDRLGTGGGMGLKPSDEHCSPLCRDHHIEQHQRGAKTFWGDNLNAMKRVNKALYSVYDKHDYMPAIRVIEAYRGLIHEK